ncbi:MAG: hypothetical protein IEMM0008_1868 [bacterium]|nr:MAG: hypothetical protein IEMM0008_1868 [bacterium]
MLSMTGYGFVEETIGNHQIAVELKSLNSRYLDVFIESPSYLGSYDNDIRKIISERVSRGKVKVSISVKEMASEVSVQVNVPLAGQLQNAYDKLLKELNLKDTIRLDHLIKWDAIFHLEESYNREDIWEKVENLLHKGINSFLTTKEKEGKATQENVLKILDEIDMDLDKIRKLAPSALKDSMERLGRRLTEMLGDHFDEQRILTEGAVLASKMDINEEIERLASHNKQFKESCLNEAILGKKLDFLTQEQLREINTMGSKAGHLDISRLVVNMKNNLEKIKEQIRNVE